MHKDAESCLNAPFGARCFLTDSTEVYSGIYARVS